jgi:hypothetical protein
MASGDTLFILKPLGTSPPSSSTVVATQGTIVDTSTPPVVTKVLLFDTTTSEHMDWHETVPSYYTGGGFDISMKSGTDHASDVGDFELEIRVRVIADATDLSGDLDLDGATPAPIVDTPPATPTNKLNYSAPVSLTHSNAGNPSAGDYIIIRATRDTATDSNLGDLQLAEILILET